MRHCRPLKGVNVKMEFDYRNNRYRRVNWPILVESMDEYIQTSSIPAATRPADIISYAAGPPTVSLPAAALNTEGATPYQRRNARRKLAAS